jgi:ATP-dependent helicase/nuclease subunit B
VPESERIFIDWSRPLLKEVVGYLLGLGETEHRVDLSGYTLCLPTSRAGRRLLEMLVQACPEGRVLSPPGVTTPGRLPELLYGGEWSGVAEGFIAKLARARALEVMDRGILEKLVPFAPGVGQTGLWLRLAGEVEKLVGELAADYQTPKGVLKKLDEGKAGAGLLFDDRDRWQALAAHEEVYREVMKGMGLRDKQHARFEAIERVEKTFEGGLILVGAPGLSLLVKKMVETLMEPERVRVIVHAPKVISDRFDALGRLDVDVWARQPVDVADEQMLFANHPEEQARLVVGLIARECGVSRASRGGPHPSPLPEGEGARVESVFVDTDQITVGLGDEAQGPVVARALEAAGLKGRVAQGLPVRQARVCVTLDALVAYLRDRRTGDLARLARCPDIEMWLREEGLDDKTPAGGEEGRRPGGVALLSCLDESITRHLPMKADTAWPGDLPTDNTARRVIALITEKLAPAGWDKARRMDLWVPVFLEMLKGVYGHRRLGNHVAGDQGVIRSLSALREACATVAFAEDARGVMPSVDFAGFIEALLLGVEQAIPAQSDPGSVELLGWLELPADDAPNLIVTGFNDGFVPESVTHDAMLPGALRSAVGLSDNTARLARDVYALSAILASRAEHGWVRLIACRRGQDERPLTPSRLLIQTGDVETVARRLRAFSDREAPGVVKPAGGLVASGEESAFLPAVPAAGEKRARFKVTEFADYAVCPYRYYLKQIRKLSSQDDRAMEMDPRAFGNLMHDVLKTFGKSGLTGMQSSEEIQGFLLDALGVRAREILGSHPPAPALIQLEVMKGRLAGFARAQAMEARRGWRVVGELVEAPLEMEVELGDATVRFYGTVDRVDYSEREGFRVLDYKTGNEPKKPGAVYKADAEGEFRWKDYQLPLYRKLLENWVRQTWPERSEAPIALGYFNLPKTAGATRVDTAQWDGDAIERAYAEAKIIAQRVRDGTFWPPGPAPAYEDDFADLCHDNDIDRQKAIERVGRKLVSRPVSRVPCPEDEDQSVSPDGGKA